MLTLFIQKLALWTPEPNVRHGSNFCSQVVFRLSKISFSRKTIMHLRNHHSLFYFKSTVALYLNANIRFLDGYKFSGINIDRTDRLLYSYNTLIQLKDCIIFVVSLISQ